VKILITNHHLALLGGTETATYTLALALREAGHEVSLATVEPGAVSHALEKQGFEVAIELEPWRGRPLDVIHAHHNTMALVARYHFPHIPMIFVGHGVIPELEQPPSVDLGIGAFAGVSEEVCQSWCSNHGIADAEVVLNAVDCERFKPTEPIGPGLKRVLVLSNHFPDDLRSKVNRACELVGAKATFTGLEDGPVWNTEEAINAADLVISLGRGIVEAMACGRAAFVFDRHGADGLITPGTYPESRRCNFSGRRFRRTLDADALAEELKQYEPGMGEANRALALRHHDISDAVRRYEGLYKRAIAAGVPENLPALPGPEIEEFQRLWRDHVALKQRARALASEHQRLRMQLDAIRPGVRAMMWRLEQERRLLKEDLERD
jgi:glycosyltransferase involved in cell wall biosynthesis